MRDIELRLSAEKKSSRWELQVYDPNVAHQIGQQEKKFDSVGHAEVWLEVFSGSSIKVMDLGASTVLRALAPAEDFDLEKILAG
jgi:hypothetical protein